MFIKQGPETIDGKPLQTINMFPEGVFAQFNGSADDVANGLKHGGSRFHVSSSAIETASLEWQFITPLWLAGGAISSAGHNPNDHLSYLVKAPASPATNNPGAGAYDKFPIGGGANMFIPNATATGDWDLNLTEKLNANVAFTKVSPVPAAQGDGFFDYDFTTEAVTLNAGQKGNCNLFDVELTIARYINKMTLSHENLTVTSIVSQIMFPHWVHRVEINHSVTDSLDVCWTLFFGRLDIS